MKNLDIKLVDGEFSSLLTDPLLDPDHLCNLFKAIKDKAYETLIVVYIHDDLQSVYDVHSLGARSQTLVDVKKLYAHGILLRASYMALIHNHPAGLPQPSDEDLAVIETILGYQEITDIKLLDFVIVAEGGHWSYFEECGGYVYSLR